MFSLLILDQSSACPLTNFFWRLSHVPGCRICIASRYQQPSSLPMKRSYSSKIVGFNIRDFVPPSVRCCWLDLKEKLIFRRSLTMFLGFFYFIFMLPAFLVGRHGPVLWHGSSCGVSLILAIPRVARRC